MITRIDFDPPMEIDINCRHCGGQLVAVAEFQEGPCVLDWTRWYDWRHVKGLARQCRPVMQAYPVDSVLAGRLVRQEIDLRNTVQQTLAEGEFP